jgi:competence protein ComER
MHMVVGVIGTGSMGSVIIHALLRSRAIEPESLIIHNRTTDKAMAIASRFPGVRVSCSPVETAVSSHVLFLCVKPLEVAPVLDKIALFLRREQVLVSIASPVMIGRLERAVPCKVAKVIPSLTNHESRGAALCMYGERMTEKDKERLERLLGAISVPVRIEEKHVRAASDLTSIGPAFVAFFVQRLAEAAAKRSGMPYEHAERLAGEMVLGTGLLLVQGGFSLDDIQRKISVPGGITAQALDVLREHFGGLFDDILAATHRKFDEDVAKVAAMMEKRQG